MGFYGILWDLDGIKMGLRWDMMGFYGIRWDYMGFLLYFMGLDGIT